MAGTPWTATQAWDYLADNIFKASDILPSFTYAAGCSDVDDFMYLSQADFEIFFEVPSKDTSGTTVTTRLSLTRVLAGKLLRAQRWYIAQPTGNYDTWRQLTVGTLNDFHERHVSSSTSNNEILPSPALQPMKADSSVTTFIKSIKRSTDDYPVLQDGKNWYSWQHRIRIKAAAHGCDNVLNKNYGPDHTT